MVVPSLAPARMGAARWLPITEEDLKTTESVVDPGAGVEILFRKHEIDDSAFNRTIYENYIRLKVFNDQGVEDVSKIDLPFDRREYIRGLRARSISPDGTITNLDPDTVYTRDIVRKGMKRRRVRTFALPGLVPGSIVEYQWTQVEDDPSTGLILRYFHVWPARHVKFTIRPYNTRRLYVRTIRFKMGEEELVKDRNGYYVLEVDNVPGLGE